MRAGRLLNLLLLLQTGRRLTAQELAERLEVSERTVLRDLEVLSGSGVPVYGTRGPGGGFQLLDTFTRDVPDTPPGLRPTSGRIRRVRVRISPAALQRAIVTGEPDGWRPRSKPSVAPDRGREDWIEGSFRFDSDDAAIDQLIGFGADVEVLLPLEMRARMAAVARRIERLHRTSSDSA